MKRSRPLHLFPEPGSTLKCDKDGNLRILIVGNSGTGKSTMAERLSHILQLPMIHLDQLHWQPNWRQTPDDEFRGKVQSFVHENDNWIIDGNCKRLLGDVTYENATCILWLDPPFALSFTRLVIRTFLRLIRLGPPCSPGCHESLGDIFSWGDRNILWWSWNRHAPQREFCISRMRQPGIDQGEKWVRLGGWGKEVNGWLEQAKVLPMLGEILV